jgi:hypothetical protein
MLDDLPVNRLVAKVIQLWLGQVPKQESHHLARNGSPGAKQSFPVSGCFAVSLALYLSRCLTLDGLVFPKGLNALRGLLLGVRRPARIPQDKQSKACCSVASNCTTIDARL